MIHEDVCLRVLSSRVLENLTRGHTDKEGGSLGHAIPERKEGTQSHSSEREMDIKRLKGRCSRETYLENFL